ncbi:MAG: DUF1330 domain-containing protein [Deinococcota bacterium]
MAYYSVLFVTPSNEDWIADYLPSANKLVAQHGGKYIARTSSHEQLEGKGEDAALRIIIEWPSQEAAKAFENDPEYQPYLQSRLNNSTSHHFLIAGKDDLA